MPTFLEGISIPRKLVRVGVLTKDATFTKSSLPANKVLNGTEIDKIPYRVYFAADVKKLRGVLFGVNQDKMAMDLLNYESGIEYPAMNITPNFYDQQKHFNNLVVADNYSLSTLLEYLGFPEELSDYHFKKLSKILTNKKELKKLAIPCAYGKINTRLTDRLDYEQELKLAGNYYKFTGTRFFDNERCYFDKSVPIEIDQKIYPAAVFELLVGNQSLGYKVTDKSEYDIVQKRKIKK